MNKTSSTPPAETADATQAAVLLEDAFARYQGELLGTLYFLVGNREDARDAVQETFVKCWRNIDQVPALDNLKAWIFRIALNTGRDLRKTAWRKRRRSMPEEQSMLTAGKIDLGSHLDREEQLQRVRRALGGLSAEQQEVFLLRQNGEMTYQQIADAIGVPVGTVKTRMRLALTRLRSALAEA